MVPFIVVILLFFLFFYIQSQIHWLWNQVEILKDEIAVLFGKLETKEREMALDRALNIQVSFLNLVLCCCSLLCVFF